MIFLSGGCALASLCFMALAAPLKKPEAWPTKYYAIHIANTQNEYLGMVISILLVVSFLILATLRYFRNRTQIEMDKVVLMFIMGVGVGYSIGFWARLGRWSVLVALITGILFVVGFSRIRLMLQKKR